MVFVMVSCVVMLFCFDESVSAVCCPGLIVEMVGCVLLRGMCVCVFGVG